MRVQTNNRAAVETKLSFCDSFKRVKEKTLKGAYKKNIVLSCIVLYCTRKTSYEIKIVIL